MRESMSGRGSIEQLDFEFEQLVSVSMNILAKGGERKDKYQGKPKQHKSKNSKY